MSLIGGSGINTTVINGGSSGRLYIYLTAYVNNAALPEILFIFGTAGTSVRFVVAPDPVALVVAPDPAAFVVPDGLR